MASGECEAGITTYKFRIEAAGRAAFCILDEVSESWPGLKYFLLPQDDTIDSTVRV